LKYVVHSAIQDLIELIASGLVDDIHVAGILELSELVLSNFDKTIMYCSEKHLKNVQLPLKSNEAYLRSNSEDFVLCANGSVNLVAFLLANLSFLLNHLFVEKLFIYELVRLLQFLQPLVFSLVFFCFESGDNDIFGVP